MNSSNISFEKEIRKCYENIKIEDMPSFASCFDLRNLSDAARLCSKGTRWKKQVQRFMIHKNYNCNQLQYELMSGTYKLSKAQPFVIMERGKARHVKSTHIRDRVVQRCLCDHVILKIINSTIIDNNAACIKDRGLSYAIDGVRRIVEAAPIDAWILKFDLKDYFGSIRAGNAYYMLSQFIDDPRMLNLIHLILQDNKGGESGQGLELGSHLSQLCGVMYLDPMDKAILGLDGVYGYSRYMDDGLVICRDKYTARNMIDYIDKYTSAFQLRLSRKKTFYNRITQPFVFCKRTFTKTEDNVSIVIKPSALKRSMEHLRSVLSSNKIIDIKPAIASTLGYVNSADGDLTDVVIGVLGEYGLDISILDQ